MMNNIILNGVNSNTIQGLIIQELPPISKPAIRTEIEEIDGRDGDVITKLGYAAYDKQLSIGLYGNYDINQVISFFNTSGTVIFSNEPDKYYNYQILNEIDFERLVRFRTAIVTMHVQPFKYSATETPQELSGTVITGEGNNISLVNTTDSGLFTDLQKKGDTEQQTYSGKNLFTTNQLGSWTKRSSVLAISYDGNNTINMSVSSTGDYSYLYSAVAKYPAIIGKTYTISYKVTKTNTTTANSNFIKLNASQVTPTSSSIGSATVTATEEYIYLYVCLNKTSGTAPSVILSDIQIEEGTSATEFEKYVGGTPSPNPDYPQEVKTVTGNNNVTICGKQLFDKDNANILNGNYYINYSSNKILTSSNANRVLYIPIIGGTTYTVSKVGSDRFSIATTNELPANNVELIDKIENHTATALTLNTSQNAKYLCVYYYRYSDTLTPQEIIDSIQIEEGTEATPYEAYQSQTYPINLGNIELCEINGTQDYIYKNNGTWYLHKTTGKVVLNGSESWTYQSDYSRVFTSINDNNNDLEARKKSICNYFIYGNTTAENNKFQIDGSHHILFRSSATTSANNFKTWLSTHNTEVYYLLATPTDTEITDSTLLSQLNALGNATTYLGTTNISTSGDGLSPILYVETVAVDDPTLKITNSGNTTAKPIMTLYGTGIINLSLNGEQIFVIDLSSENYITIDVANMEAYYNGILKNRLVTGNYENFVLNQGENEITFTGTLYSLTISNYSRWI